MTLSPPLLPTSRNAYNKLLKLFDNKNCDLEKEWGFTNPGLLFNRYVHQLTPRGSSEGKDKYKFLENICRAAEHIDKNLLNAWVKRWIEGVKSTQPNCYFRMKTEWHFLTGIGQKGALEIGFTFNRYGFPILPGSAVKGLARSWALRDIYTEYGLQQVKRTLNELDQLLSTATEKAYQKELENKCWGTLGENELNDKFKPTMFRRVFGTQETAGKVVFWDAVPINKPALKIDPVNNHFTPYYQEGKPPANWFKPILNYLLSVDSNTLFYFGLSIRDPSPVSAGVMDGDLLKTAKVWLMDALENLGAGAKTSSGYGYFGLDGDGEDDA